jgi:hypothetical protein
MANRDEGWKFQQASIDEQSFSTLSSDVVPLSLVGEGDEVEFLNLITHGTWLPLEKKFIVHSILGLMESQ